MLVTRHVLHLFKAGRQCGAPLLERDATRPVLVTPDLVGTPDGVVVLEPVADASTFDSERRLEKGVVFRINERKGTFYDLAIPAARARVRS